MKLMECFAKTLNLEKITGGFLRTMYLDRRERDNKVLY